MIRGLAVILAAAVSTHHPLQHRHGYPAGWVKQAACIRHYESRNRWHIRNPPYGGAYQFLDSTWAAHAPRGWDVSWRSSPARQTFVAWRTYLHDGRSWREWSTAGLCDG